MDVCYSKNEMLKTNMQRNLRIEYSPPLSHNLAVKYLILSQAAMVARWSSEIEGRQFPIVEPSLPTLWTGSILLEFFLFASKLQRICNRLANASVSHLVSFENHFFSYFRKVNNCYRLSNEFPGYLWSSIPRIRAENFPPRPENLWND